MISKYVFLLKLGGLLIGLSALGFLVWDYFSLREYKSEAKAQIMQQDQKIKALEEKEKFVNEMRNFRDELVNRTQEVIKEAETQAAKEKAEFTSSQLERVSKLENEFSKGSDRLTRRARIATKEVFSELEELSDLSTTDTSN